MWERTGFATAEVATAEVAIENRSYGEVRR